MLDIQASVSYYKPWLLFWLTVLCAHLYLDVVLYKMLKHWFTGMKLKDFRRDKIGLIIKIWFEEVFFQRHLYGFSRFRWAVHLLIFWGFIALAFLSIATFTVWAAGLLKIEGGRSYDILYGSGYKVIKIWGNGFGIALLLGLFIACYRRFIVKSPQQSREQMDAALLIFLLWLTISGFALEALRISVIDPEIARYSFISYLFAPMGRYSFEQLSPVLTVLWILHSFSGVLLLVYLPHSKLMHSMIAPLVIAINAVEDHDRRDIYWPEVKKYKERK